MNYVLPQQKSEAVATLVQRRARQVVEEVRQQIAACEKQSLGQSGYLTWSSLQGTVWGHFEEGRCCWLLVIEAAQERVVYYRHRGDQDDYELHSPGHGGGSLFQRVEQLGLLTNHYTCSLNCQLTSIHKRIRWFHLQRWMDEIKKQVRVTRPFPNWLSERAPK